MLFWKINGIRKISALLLPGFSLKNTHDMKKIVFHGNNKNVCSYGEVYCYDNNVITKLKKDIDKLYLS